MVRFGRHCTHRWATRPIWYSATDWAISETWLSRSTVANWRSISPGHRYSSAGTSSAYRQPLYSLSQPTSPPVFGPSIPSAKPPLISWCLIWLGAHSQVLLISASGDEIALLLRRNKTLVFLFSIFFHNYFLFRFN